MHRSCCRGCGPSCGRRGCRWRSLRRWASRCRSRRRWPARRSPARSRCPAPRSSACSRRTRARCTTRRRRRPRRDPSPHGRRGRTRRWINVAERRSTHGVGPRERPGARARGRRDGAPEPVVVLPRRRHGRSHLEVLRRPDRDPAGRDQRRRHLGQGRAPVRVAAARRLDRARPSRTRADLHPRRRRPLRAPRPRLQARRAPATRCRARSARRPPPPHRGTTWSRTGSRSRAGSALGSFAFGISGIQPHLPAGWSGGNQLAIHGTNDPSSIGTSASAGCVRVSEWALAHFEPLLRLGTPVVIHG